MKFRLNHKLDSGALQFAVFIAALIALLLGGLILYAYTFGYFKEQSKASIENIQLSDTGINYLLNQPEINSDTLTHNLTEDKNYIIKTQLSQWGIFEKAFVKTQHRKKVFVKTAVLGTLLDTEHSPTLYLQDTYNPLNLVGTAKIKGIAYLPTQGVKSGYIAGQSYYGTQLIYGKTEKSKAELPKVSQEYLNQIKFYLESYKPTAQEDFIGLEPNKKTVHSFREKTKNVYSAQPIILENVTVAGNIIIKSEVLIKIKKSAVLKDIILIAPVIEVEEGTVGNFQAIASKKITVNKDCKLNHPTALVLYQDNKNGDIPSEDKLDNKIFIDSGTILNGCVGYFQTKKISSDFNTQIVLEEKSRIKGQVYCEGSFELKGTVSGSVYTKQFIANQSGTIFVNYIYNGIIENENVPEKYGGILFEKEKKTVVKWLY